MSQHLGSWGVGSLFRQDDNLTKKNDRLLSNSQSVGSSALHCLEIWLNNRKSTFARK